MRIIVFFHDSLEKCRLQSVNEVEKEVSVDVVFFFEVGFIWKVLT